MDSHKKQKLIPITLSRTLGVWEVTLLGVGALLGGGIFTLLGHAAGFAGGGLVFAMLLGALISFLNLNAYVSLATTFPEAGGGYLWVRDGLGDLQGFLAGWISWMAHAVACSLYAASFGIYAGELIFSLMGMPDLGVSHATWQIIFTAAVIIVFSVVNYRGVALTGRVGGYISLVLLVILFFYIVFGIKRIIGAPELLGINFSPLLPFGILGVVQAASLFYIAFEGSEIQAQTGEEAKDPARTLKIGLFSSWAIISALYLLIAFVITGATANEGTPSWKILGNFSDRAIIESARQFLPLGHIIMVLGGLLANIAALNATIYSSSRVLFAMARDKFVFSRLGVVHELSQTPYRAVLLSALAIILVAILLPIKDIAGAADILFIALFFQLNMAYIQLRRKKPEARWHYIVPFGIALPLFAMILYLLLGISLFHVSPAGIYFTVFWFLLGLINYFGYTKTQEREEFTREVVYEHAVRFREKTDYRVILPVASEERINELSALSFAMAKQEDGEVLALRIHEVPQSLPLNAGFHADHERRVLDRVEKAATEEKINIGARVMAARSVPDALLGAIQVESGKLLVMGWDGYVNAKGFIFGRKVDVILHRAKCDLIVAKFPQTGEAHFKKIFIPISLDENPNLRFTGKVATALSRRFGAASTVCMVIPEKTTTIQYAKYFSLLEDRIKELKIKTESQPEIKFIRSDHVISAIIKEAVNDNYDVVLLPAARSRITKAITMGSIPEQVAKHLQKRTVIMAKGYRGTIQPFFDYIRSRF